MGTWKILWHNLLKAADRINDKSGNIYDSKIIFTMEGIVEFFKNVPGRLNLQAYNIYHFFAILTLIVLIACIIFFRDKLRDEKIDFRVRIIATIIAFSLEFSFHLSNYVYNTEFVLRLIPLDLCAMSLWLAFALVLTKKKSIFNLLYFWGIGAIASVLYPDIAGIGPDRMRYYHFFGVHTYIILAVIYYIVVHGYKINFKSLVNAFIVLLPISIIVRYIDFHFYSEYATNWMFLIKPPDINSILDLLPQGGWAYYFSLATLAIIVFLVFLVPWLIKVKYDKRRNHRGSKG